VTQTSLKLELSTFGFANMRSAIDNVLLNMVQLEFKILIVKAETLVTVVLINRWIKELHFMY